MQDRLLNLAEAADVMRCSYSKALKIARAGKLPFRKIGANWVIARSVLYRELGLSVGGEEWADGNKPQRSMALDRSLV